MAGAGYKLFNTGDVLTAAQVNTYLMEQTVMVFADAAARTTALTGVVSEGMISYLKDTNAVEVYNGSAWVSSDDPNAIQNTIVDAKGDLITATASDVPARLAVGNNGETLVADSSTSTGLRWQQPKQVNGIINSSMQVWQRGTSGAIPANSASSYSADRWATYRAVSGSTVSRQVTNDNTNLPQIQYCARVQRDSGNTATDVITFAYAYETIDSVKYSGQTVTFSFYARRGANYSPTSNIMRARVLYNSSSTDQSIIVGSWAATPIDQNATLTTTWQRFTYTTTLPTPITQIGIAFTMTPTGTAGAADFFEITGVQFEIGSVATPYQPCSATLAGELAACQRYYVLLANGTNQAIANGFYYTAAEIDGVIHLPVAMRQSPSIAQVTGTNYYGFLCNNATDTFNSLTVGRLQAGNTALSVYNNSEVSGTAGQAGFISTNNASSFLAFSAEL